jgi:RNA polymerase sigma-70 factor (ECF subfamily)
VKAPFNDCQEVAPVTDWERIVREHGPRVFGTAWRILGHAADAEDVVQEVFLQAHQLQRTRPIRFWGAFLRRLAACRALDRLRQRRATVPLDGHDTATADDGPEEAAIGHELASRLRAAIARLPEREAGVFCLRYYEELSYEEIAESLGIAPGAVGVALHKARAKLETQFSRAVTGD